MLLYLALKNIITKKSSYVIVLFIAFAIMMLVVTNAVFDSTEQGIQETFVSSFTGDVVVRPKNSTPLSLFGDETPVTGKLSEVPVLFPYVNVTETLQQDARIGLIAPQITGLAAMSFNDDDDRDPIYMFGIEGEKYLQLMPSIKLVQGESWKNGDKGAMISAKLAEKYGVKLGDTVQLAISSGLSSRLRAVPLTGIYEYKNENTLLDKIILVNSETVRSLLDISDVGDADSVQLEEDKEAFLGDVDLDDLFSDASDFSESVETEEITFTEEEQQALQSAYSSSTWGFIICRLNNSQDSKAVIKSLNAIFKQNEWPVEAVNWRSAAGNTAFYLYVLRLILNVGIIIVLGAGFIVVNNTLVINVLDRIREIGTMRAIGANKRYISAECMAETILMALVSGVLGCILGCIASFIVTKIHITFSNSFLIQLFGGNTLVTQVNISNLTGSFGVAVLIGLIAWIYPVLNALKVNPVQAMQGAK
ncbi:MAG: ABC transporter permease [Treponema sp.]|nr:ABC transporter permease [Candidatus Treponema equifaecale]